MSQLVVFSHGKESGPWGTKILQLAEVAKEQGFAVESVDYRGIDDPDERVTYLLAQNFQAETLVLAGSSMGAYVALGAAEQWQPQGLFLMAPAVGMPGCECPQREARADRVMVVHGWRDEIVPVANVLQFAQRQSLPLQLLNDSHRLTGDLKHLAQLFANFLTSLRV